jgi:hypothetical protein
MYRYTVPVVCGYSTGFRGICSFSFSSHLITIKTVCMSAWQMVHYSVAAALEPELAESRAGS